MGRARIERASIFRMLSLNYPKKKIKKEAGLSERTYFRALGEYEALSEEEKRRIYIDATKEEEARAKFLDYPLVQEWVSMMQSEKLKSWRKMLRYCERVWLLLQKKNPENWTYEDIKLRAIPELRKGKKSIFTFLVAVRSLRPDFKTGFKAIKTKGEKVKPQTEWKIAYKALVREGRMQEYSMSAGEHEVLVRNHIEWGCREGTEGYWRWRRGEASEREIGGILGARWENVDWEARTIDIYETKTGGGFMWQDCPMCLFGETAYKMLREYWEKQGRPTQGRIFQIDPHQLADIYEQIREHFKTEEWSKYIRAHFDRKLHASLLRAKGVPLELVSGEAPRGIMGVGWEDVKTLQEFYLTFAEEEELQALEKAQSWQL